MRYSDTWIDTFLDTTDPRTGRELDFLHQFLPLPEYSEILDVCCGTGRHASGLAGAGHSVVGVDSSRRSLAAARRRTRAAVRLIVADMRALPVAGPFDAALIMWQSFGMFDDATNHAIITRLRDLLRPSGRLILDIYNRGFFEDHQGERESVRNGRVVRERKWMEGDRLRVRLEYEGSAETDVFDWRVYHPDEIMNETDAIGFSTICCCTGFAEEEPVSRSSPRMQIVLSRH